MRVDCINRCLGQKIKEAHHNCLYPFYPHFILWRNDSAYSSYQDMKYCEYNGNIPEIINERVQMRNECEVKFRPDCVNRYYRYIASYIDPPITSPQPYSRAVSLFPKEGVYLEWLITK